MSIKKYLFSTLVVALVASCGHREEHDHSHHEQESAEMHDEDEHDHEGAHDDEADDHDEHHHSPDDILLEPEKAKAAGVETKVVNRGTFNNVIQVSGCLMAASCDETTIVATVSGVVAHAQHISEGMAIKQGSVIYHITSNQLKEGDQAEHIRINYETAKREYERALPLVKDLIITEKDFNAIKSEYERASLAYQAIGSKNTAKGVAVTSPVTGYMKKCMVTDGDYVQEGAPMMVVTKNQHLYLRAEVPVRYYSSLNKISSAKFRTQYSDEIIDLKSVNGKLLSSGKSAVSTSSYVPVTFQLDNKGEIVPGAYAEVFLLTDVRKDVLSVPTAALTEEQGVYYVYEQEDEHTYSKHEVKLGATDGENTEIVSGLKGGERVVTKGAINVKLAGASKEIPGHTHNH